ncbi:MAG TPA: cupin domain-containing protein [Pirellulales bacterium]|nr:cupin domain-containing protein [Pirellulales bacterium]
MNIQRRFVLGSSAILAVFAAVTCAQTPGKPAAVKPAMESTVFDWNQVKVDPQSYGERRQIFDGRTGALDHLECHASTINPGQSTHPPRRQPDEELVIVKEGTIEAIINDQPRKVEAGSAIFVAANDLYGVRNTSDAPATYYVIKWSTGAPPKEQAK